MCYLLIQEITFALVYPIEGYEIGVHCVATTPPEYDEHGNKENDRGSTEPRANKQATPQPRQYHSSQAIDRWPIGSEALRVIQLVAGPVDVSSEQGILRLADQQ